MLATETLQQDCKSIYIYSKVVVKPEKNSNLGLVEKFFCRSFLWNKCTLKNPSTIILKLMLDLDTERRDFGWQKIQLSLFTWVVNAQSVLTSEINFQGIDSYSILEGNLTVECLIRPFRLHNLFRCQTQKHSIGKDRFDCRNIVWKVLLSRLLAYHSKFFSVLK